MTLKNNYVSVILPTYNRANLLLRSINSVLDQTYKYIELIIVDDGSKDNTQKVVSNIRDSRIRYFRLIKNHGQSHARNFGIRKARYKLIAFQDSDDEWVKDKLEKQINYLKRNSDYALIYSEFIRKTEKFDRIFPSNNLINKEGNIYSVLLKHAIIGLPTVIIRKDVLFEVGLFDVKMRAMEDQDLFLRISKKYLIGFIDEVLVVAHGKDHISDKPDLLISSISRLINKHRCGYNTTKEGLCRQYFKLMDSYLQLGDRKNATICFKKIICNKFLHIKAIMSYFCFICLGKYCYNIIRKCLINSF